MRLAAAVSLLLVSCAARGPAGLGLQVEQLDEGLLVVEVEPRSSGQAAGLSPGDLLVQVDGRPAKEAVDLLRGPPRVELELVVRAALGGEFREVKARRSHKGRSAAPSEELALPEPLAVAWDPAGSWRARAGEGGLGLEPGQIPTAPPEPLTGSPGEGEPLQLRTLDGEPWALVDAGGRPALIAFFATWCAPCRPELTELAALVARRGESAPRVLALSLDDPGEEESVRRYVEALDLPFPAAHLPAVGARFGVDVLPSLRLVDAEGRLLWASRGYAPGALARLEHWMDGSSAQSGRLLGWTWSPRPVELVSYQAVPGAVQVTAAPEGVAITRADGPPLVLAREGGGAGFEQQGAGGGDRLAWLDGPVRARAGGLWVRASSVTGRPRWLFSTEAPIVDVVASAGVLWIATESDVLAVDPLGRLLRRRAGGVRALAAAPEGGVWAVDGRVRLRLGLDDEDALPAPGAVGVDGLGRVLGQEGARLVSGRFGPDGARTSLLLRADGHLVALGEDGEAIAQLWLEEGPPRPAVADLDGDGQDELWLLLPGIGLLRLALRLP